MIMKDIKSFILESKIEDAIDDLVNLFKRTILKNTKLSENDFEELDDNTFNLCNVPQDGKLAQDFFDKRSSLYKSAIHTADSESMKEIAIVQAGKDDIFIRINLDTENGDGYKKGDILSVDMSKEIKDKLI